jgi:hippurate hydrolase
MQAGQALNAIPEEARLAGTVRTFSVDVLDTIEQQLRTLCTQVCAAFGATATVRFERNYPPTVNHPAMAALAASVLEQALGSTAVRTDMPPSMGAEDFAYMLQAKPGAYLWIGNGEGDHRCAGHGLGPCTLHNPSYDFNDRILPVGVKAWLALVHGFFNADVRLAIM